VSQANDGAGDELQGAVSRWRLATAIAATVALALFAVAVGDRMVPSVNPHAFVAVLTSASVPPAFVATVNLDSPTLVIRRLTDPPPADRNYVLWAASAKGGSQPLGVLDQPRNAFPFDLTSDVTLQVSLESKAAPIPSAPAGPIVFQGNLVAGN
jgi:anti-sigma-K factor RskA